MRVSAPIAVLAVIEGGARTGTLVLNTDGSVGAFLNDQPTARLLERHLSSAGELMLPAPAPAGQSGSYSRIVALADDLGGYLDALQLRAETECGITLQPVDEDPPRPE
jgi:hypothetical protein